jgi:hypothetical protein
MEFFDGIVATHGGNDAVRAAGNPEPTLAAVTQNNNIANNNQNGGGVSHHSAIVTPPNTGSESSHTPHRPHPGSYQYFHTPNQTRYTPTNLPINQAYNTLATYPLAHHYPPPYNTPNWQQILQHQQLHQRPYHSQQFTPHTGFSHYRPPPHVPQPHTKEKKQQPTKKAAKAAPTTKQTKKEGLIKINKNRKQRRQQQHQLTSKTLTIGSAAATDTATFPVNKHRTLATSKNKPNLFDKIDMWHGDRTWAALASRVFHTSDLFSIVQFHAYINSNVQRMVQDVNSTGATTRCYKCKVGSCGWSILFRRESATRGLNKNHIPKWKMDDTSTTNNHFTQCDCQSPTTGIPGSTLVNMSQFHNFVRRTFVPSQTISHNTAITLLISEGIQVRFDNAQYSKCTVAVTKYILQVLVPREFAELPSFLHLLADKNKNLTVALQSEVNTNSFLRLFVGFPIALEVGELTMDVMVTDCFHQKSKNYDGVVMHIVSRTGFGRTILCAIAIIPIEDTNHISWVIQMCWRHGMDLKCGLFTDQGPLLSAARTLFDKFQIELKLQLCLQHIIRCIRAMYPSLFKKTKKK